MTVKTASISYYFPSGALTISGYLQFPLLAPMPTCQAAEA